MIISGTYGLRRPTYPTATPNETADDRSSRLTEWNKQWSRHISSLKDFSVTLTEKIRGGSWNSSVTVTLPNIKASEFGYLELSLKGNQVEMFK